MYGKKMDGHRRTNDNHRCWGKVRRIFPKVKVAGHVDEVLQAIAEMAQHEHRHMSHARNFLGGAPGVHPEWTTRQRTSSINATTSGHAQLHPDVNRRSENRFC